MAVDKLIFVLMIATAVFVVASKNLKKIIVAMGALSLLASFCYLIYHAPDVAVAEAVIGSALSTILYIVALKKHRSFYVYLSSNAKEKKSDRQIRAAMEDVVTQVRGYCSENELEPLTVFTSQSPEEINEEHLYDLILENKDGKVIIYGSNVEKHVVGIKTMLANKFKKERIELKTFEIVDFYAPQEEEIS